MKFLIDHAELRRALSLCQSAVAKRQIIPILANVRIDADGERVRFGATDLQSTVLTSSEATVSTHGACTVDMAALSDVAKNASAPLTLHEEGGWLSITTGNSRYRIPTAPIEDYPTLPDISDADSVTFSASDFLPMLRIVSYPMTAEETRAQLAGVLLKFRKKIMDAAASDGHRLALAELPGRFGEDEIMLPSALVKNSSKLSASANGTTVNLAWSGGQVAVTLGADTIMAQRVDVNFLAYRQFLPASFAAEVRIDTAALLSLLKSAAPFGRGESRVVALDFKPGMLSITAENQERGSSSSSAAVDYSGSPFRIGFSARNIIEPLEAIGTSAAWLRFAKADGDGPLLVEPDDSAISFSHKHLVMAIRID